MVHTPWLFREELSLLESALEAHGGLDRWQRFSKVEEDAVTTGGLFPERADA
jgi:hypothetical protein